MVMTTDGWMVTVMAPDDSSGWYELSNGRNIFCLSLPAFDLGLCPVQPTQQARLRFTVSELRP